ncbi:MAG: hypothetical protein ACE5FD_04005 [Anaerolineae bacterium]
MSDCCSTDESCAVPAEQAANTAVSVNPAEGTCPSCGEKGKTVDTQIVKAMLAVSLEAVRPSASYRFCRTESCPIVYYSDEAGQFFTEDQLRERVHQKHPTADDVNVCYCFNHSPGSIRAEFEQGITNVVARVTEGTKTGQCACDIRNPQGSCCLGNVGKVVKRIEAEIATAVLV